MKTTTRNNFRLYIAIVVTILCSLQIDGMPNYCDPSLIVNSPDIFWHFGFTEEDLVRASKYPRIAQNLLDQIRHSVAKFKKYFKKDDAETLTNEAIGILEKAEKRAAEILAPTKLTDADREKLAKITATILPEEILELNPTILDYYATLQDVLRCGGSLSSEQIALRVHLEEKYIEFHAWIKKLRTRTKLTTAEKVLIQRAEDAFDLAYTTIGLHAGFHNRDAINLKELFAQEPAKKLFRIDLKESKDELQKYLIARLEGMKLYLIRSMPNEYQMRRTFNELNTCHLLKECFKEKSAAEIQKIASQSSKESGIMDEESQNLIKLLGEKAKAISKHQFD